MPALCRRIFHCSVRSQLHSSLHKISVTRQGHLEASRSKSGYFRASVASSFDDLLIFLLQSVLDPDGSAGAGAFFCYG